MGQTKISSEGQTTQKATPTAAELEMQNLELGNMKQANPMMMQNQMQMLGLTSNLLGGQPLPGYFNQLAQGITPQTIAAQASAMGRQAMPGFQSLGILDSGEAQRSISQQIANELLYPAQQFNIGSLQNLMNMAMGGQAQVQGQQQAGFSTLGSQLAGLRTITGTSNQSQTTGYDFFTSPFTNSMLQAGGTAAGGWLGRVK